jgi:membrane associated rhomboid family serine protease
MMRITDTVKHLIIINVLLWLTTVVLGMKANIDLNNILALHFPENNAFGFWQPITSMFMHAVTNPIHILFNMIGLWMFGSALEMRWGKIKFLSFYFITGVGAALVHTVINYYDFYTAQNILFENGFTGSDVHALFQLPYENFIEQLNTHSFNGKYISDIQGVYDNGVSYYSTAVGASGALYGVLVAFGMLYPNTELMLMFIPIPIKAKYFIPGLLGYDFIAGISGGAGLFGGGNVAHFAHLGGALFGFLLMWYWNKTQFTKNRWD